MDRRKVIQSHFRKSDPVLFSVIQKIGLPQLHPKSDNLFSSLCEIIINQQLSDKAASTIFNKFKLLFPHQIITPRQLLKIPDDQIRTAGPSKSKIIYMRGLAESILNKKIDLMELDGLNDIEVIKRLTELKGLGNWSAEMFLLAGLGRVDVFSPGDLGLRKAIKKLYKLKKEPTIKQMEKISKKWIPYRTYASRCLWNYLDEK